MKIYTRTGDLGETALYQGPRVGKDMARIEVVGDLDELNALLGVVRSGSPPGAIDRVAGRIQNELFEIGAEISTPQPERYGTQTVRHHHVEALEADIDCLEADLLPLKDLILPGGTRTASELHLARTVCRRAERRLVTLVRQSEEEISIVLLAYLNRLADLLFVLARAANAKAGLSDVPWQKHS